MKKFILLPLFTLILSACTSPSAPEETSMPVPGEEGVTEQEVTQNEATSAGDEAMMEEATTYTLADVAEHTTPTDCWIAVEGKVYDVSNFGDTHGGGEAVYEGCGLDATDYYNDRSEFSGKDSPDAHSDTARGFLPNFYIGDLVTE